MRAGQLLIRLDDRDFRAASTARPRSSRSGRRPSRASRQESSCSNRPSAGRGRCRREEGASGVHQRGRRSLPRNSRRRAPARSKMRKRRLASNAVAQSAVALVRGGARRRETAARRPGCADRRSASRRRRGRGRSCAPPSSTSATPKSARRSTATSAIAPPRPAPMSPGGAYLVTVIPAHDLWVDANFKEDQLGTWSPGQA